MAVWRPASAIRVKVLGLAWRGGRLLAGEVETDAGAVKGVRPLGGVVEFGETREAALAREFREELDVAVRILGPWHAFENIYRHEGSIGHEFIFAADIELETTSLYEQDVLSFNEQGGGWSRARWFGLSDLVAEGLDLYPPDLLPLLAARRR